MATQITEMLEPLKKISEDISSINKTEEFNKILSTSTPEEAKAYISNEIKNTEELINKVEKIKNDITSKTKINSMTNWWNGMGYDF